MALPRHTFFTADSRHDKSLLLQGLLRLAAYIAVECMLSVVITMRHDLHRRQWSGFLEGWKCRAIASWKGSQKDMNCPWDT
eukprot:1156355-Pelagomonas_calceolata.AAC.14